MLLTAVWMRQFVNIADSSLDESLLILLTAVLMRQFTNVADSSLDETVR
jgi:hypothetical protein